MRIVKINKQKPHINRVRRPKWGFSHPLMTAEPNRKKKDSFPGQDSANDKPWTLCFLQSPEFLFLPIVAIKIEVKFFSLS